MLIKHSPDVDSFGMVNGLHSALLFHVYDVGVEQRAAGFCLASGFYSTRYQNHAFSGVVITSGSETLNPKLLNRKPRSHVVGCSLCSEARKPKTQSRKHLPGP